MSTAAKSFPVDNQRVQALIVVPGSVFAHGQDKWAAPEMFSELPE